jgi:hypothetical protein
MNLIFLMLLFGIFSFIMAQDTLVVTPGTPVLDGVISPGEWTSSALVTKAPANVTLNAMADGQYLYLSASWEDPTESIPKNQWTFDGASWSKSGNEDRIGFIWDMGDNGDEGVNCATMCHAPLMHTEVGKVDVWHWKAARGNALGYTDDKYFDNVLGGDGGRHGDSGTSAYSDNGPIGSGYPGFMADSDPDADMDFLVKTADALNAWDPYGTVAAHTVAQVVAFDSNATFATGSVIPGYVLRIPDGDRASVQSAGKFDNGVWTVEFKRAYAGTDNDFEVVPGSSVEFTHEIFDNTGGGHINDGWDATIYELDFSQIVTSIDNSFSQSLPSDFSLKQNYPNPFNPSTTIEFKIAKNGFVSLNVFDVMGQKVVNLVDKEMIPGTFQVVFDGQNLASGIYFYNITVENFSQTQKMILMK